MTCPDENSLARLLDGGLTEVERQSIERHLDGCGTCSAVVAELARMAAPQTPHVAHVCTVCGASYPTSGTCGGDGGQIRTTHDPLLGSDVGAYRFVRPLGEGGMGKVYVALQRDVGGRVAIKVINRDHAEDPELTKRFLVEARAVNRIHHRGIVKVLDLVHLHDGRPAIVMELIEGPTLRAVERARDTSMTTLVEIMIEVLEALAAAHAIGIVHRDLKPDNIVISSTGPRILDFGIAKVVRMPVGQTAPRTRTGALLGTPEYMAPEQVLGVVADARSDIYAAGVVLFEALTGTRPFGGATDFEVMRGQLELPAPSVRALRPAIPIALERVIACALAKQPEQRFATAEAMATALRAACAELPAGQLAIDPAPRFGVVAAPAVIDAPATVRATPFAQRTRRRRVAWTAGLALATSGAVVIAMRLHGAARHELAHPDPPAAPGPEPASDLVKLVSAPVADRHLDPVVYLPVARELARRLEPDAELTGMYFEPVATDGTVIFGPAPDRADPARRSLAYTFISHDRAKQLATATSAWCAIGVWIDGDGTVVRAGRSPRSACNDPVIARPRCTARQLWTKALALGFDPKVPATLTWSTKVWFSGVRAGKPYGLPLPDDCPANP